MKSCLVVFSTIIISLVLFISCDGRKPVLHGRYYTGLLFGKPYHIDVVGDSTDHTAQIDSIIGAFQNAYDLTLPNSILSRYNKFQRTDTAFVFYDSTRAFGLLYDLTRDLHRYTMQYYDPTTNPLKRAWAVANYNQLGEPNLDSLYEFIGFDGAKMDLTEIEENYIYQVSHLRKADPRIEADFTRLAAAMTVDYIGDYLKTSGALQFRIKYDRSILTHGIQVDTLNVFPMGIADEENDQHIRIVNRAYTYKTAEDKQGMVDVTYGYPVENEMVFVAVSAPTLAESEAFAEAFMIMGLAKISEYYTNNKDSNVESSIFFIEDDVMHSASTAGFDEMLFVANDSLQ